ncbi:50S ribosomal protein L11 methyltransferase [bacterium]|nr:50S ribosomal protein L11 methyltransferase [bacterium]
MIRSREYKTWLEIRFSAESQVLDAVANLFFELGSSGCEQTEDTIVAYFSNPREEERVRRALRKYLNELMSLGFDASDFRMESRIIPQQDWNTEWKKRFKPINVSKSLVVKPTWKHLKASRGQVVIEIDPKQAFGTGSHATTQMALRLLESHLSTGDRVLDVGTGTGILAIAAVKLGATNVVALDIDPVAIAAAKENLSRNRTLVKTSLLVTDLVDMKAQLSRFDLILANINRREIVRLLPHFQCRLADRGRVIITGILQDERVAVTERLQDVGLMIVERIVDEEWLAMVLQKGVQN